MWRHSVDDVMPAIVIVGIQPHNKENWIMCQLARSFSVHVDLTGPHVRSRNRLIYLLTIC